MSPDPIAFGQAAAHSTLKQDRRPFTVLRGGGGSPGQLRPVRSHVTDLRPTHPTTMVPLSLPLQTVTLILAALGQASPTLQAAAEEIAAQVHPSLLPAWMSADDAPAHGIQRPGGAS